MADLLAQFPGDDPAPIDEEIPGMEAEVAVAEERVSHVLYFDGLATADSWGS